MSLPTTIVSLDGSCSSVDIYFESTVDDIKDMCSEENGLDSTLFDLTYEGDILTSDKKVMEYGLQDGCELEMVRSQKSIALEKLGDRELSVESFFDEVSNGGELIPSFLDAGMDVDCCDGLQQSALHVLCQSGMRVSETTNLIIERVYTSAEVAQILISRGANISQQCKFLRNTPLHIAKDPKVACLLIKHNAPVDFQNNCGDTPLHSQVGRSADISRILIEAGANVNLRNMFNNTAIHNFAALQVLLP